MSRTRGVLQSLALLSAGFLLSACAGFRSGIESLAYVDNPEAVPAKRGPGYIPPHVLRWRSLDLSVRLNNAIQTRDFTVMLFVVPTSVDPFDKFSEPDATSRLRIHLEVKAEQPGYVFDPDSVRFVVNQQVRPPVNAAEYAKWNAQGEIDAAQGQWAYRKTTGPRVLSAPGSGHTFQLEFDMPAPSPREEHFQLDLRKAIQTPEGAEGPVLKFKAVPWEQGYT